MVRNLQELGGYRHAMYRRDVCQYLSRMNKDDKILKEMEACLGRHALVYNDHPPLPLQEEEVLPKISLQQQPTTAGGDASSIASSKKNHSKGNNENVKNMQMKRSVPAALIHCFSCGVILQGRIRIHSIQRGRTRRRRASRMMAAMKRNQHRSSQHKSAAYGVSTAEEEETKEFQQLLFRVTDGTCKNILVQTCDNCHVARKMKGIPKSKTTTTTVKSTMGSHNKGYSSYASSKRTATTNTAIHTTVGTNEKHDDVFRLDFLSLPPSSTAIAAASTTERNNVGKVKGSYNNNNNSPGNRQPPKRPMTNMLGSGNPKKKKTRSEPKSNLMNFLSSLNNH